MRGSNKWFNRGDKNIVVKVFDGTSWHIGPHKNTCKCLINMVLPMSRNADDFRRR